jgi:sulfate transport system permease protein
VTSTLPLQIELLYQDHNVIGAFIAASVLMLFALLAIFARLIFERSGGDRQPETALTWPIWVWSHGSTTK